MEQPRPLRRRRRSSRRGAGPPSGPSTSAAADTPSTRDPSAAVPTAGTATAGVPNEDGATSGLAVGEPRTQDSDGLGTSSPATPGDATNPRNQPVEATVVANAAVAAPTELDDPLTGTAAAELPHTFAGSPGTAAATGPGHPSEHGRPSGEGPRRTYRTPREDQSERSLRALVTTRSTQVSATAAMRAREVAVPTQADLLAAEIDLVMVRRHYVPPTALAAGRRRDRSERRPDGGGQTGGSQAGNTQSTGGSQPSGQHPGNSPTDRTVGHPGG